MTEALWVAIIVQTGGVVAAVLAGGKKLNRIDSNAKETRDQTANTHKTNLRDDLDDIRGEVRGIARQVARFTTWMSDLTAADEAIERSVDRQALANAREIARAHDEQEARMENMRRDLIARIDQHCNPPE